MAGGFGAAQGGFPQQPGQPQQPGLVQAGQGGFGQGTSFSPPPGFQSPYANYGFDPGFQSYLDQRYQLGNQAQDLGQYSYDPTNQMFTLNGAFTYPGAPTSTMSLADMQNRYQNPYQPPTMPLNKPGMDINQIKEMYRGQPRPMQPQGPQRPFNPRPYPGQGNDMAIAPPYNPRPMPQMPQFGQRPQPQGPQQRGLGGLQIDKFKSRLDQSR